MIDHVIENSTASNKRRFLLSILSPRKNLILNMLLCYNTYSIYKGSDLILRVFILSRPVHDGNISIENTSVYFCKINIIFIISMVDSVGIDVYITILIMVKFKTSNAFYAISVKF